MLGAEVQQQLEGHRFPIPELDEFAVSYSTIHLNSFWRAKDGAITATVSF